MLDDGAWWSLYSSGDPAVIGAVVMESNIESIYEQITDITLIFKSIAYRSPFFYLANTKAITNL